MSFIRIVCSLALTCALGACVSTPRVNPPAPPPSFAADLPPAEPSSLVVPIVFRDAVRAVEAAADGMLPYIVGEDNGGCIEYGAYFPPRRSGRKALSITGSENKLSSRAGLEYRVKVCVLSIGCGYGEDPRRMTVGFDTTLDLTPDWSLATKSRPYSHPENQCRVSLLKLDETKHAAKVVNDQLERLGARIDGEIHSRAKIKPAAQTAWDRLQQPLRVTNGLWLMINPATVGVSKIQASDSDIGLTLNLTARPIVRASAATPFSPVVPLPALETVPRNLDGKFRIALDGIISYAEASKLANESYRGRMYPMLGGKIKIEQVRIYGSGKMLILQVDLSGDVEGTLYLQGTPTYLPQTPEGLTDVITVKDLEYTFETKRFLQRVAAWLLKERLQESLRAAATFPLTAKISVLKNQANAALNRDFGGGVVMTGSLSGIRLVGVYTDTDRFVARAIADGAVKLDVRF